MITITRTNQILEAAGGILDVEYVVSTLKANPANLAVSVQHGDRGIYASAAGEYDHIRVSEFVLEGNDMRVYRTSEHN